MTEIPRERTRQAGPQRRCSGAATAGEAVAALSLAREPVPADRDPQRRPGGTAARLGAHGARAGRHPGAAARGSRGLPHRRRRGRRGDDARAVRAGARRAIPRPGARLVRAHRPCARAHRHARRPPSRHGPGQQPARRQRSRRRQALGQPRGLPRSRPADAALRRDARHRPVRRAAGRAGAVPAPAVQPRLPDADRQGAVPLRPRPRPGARQLRDVPDRLRPRRGDVPRPPRAATR